VSARADEPVVVEGMNNGALGSIEKPFDPYTAVLRVRDAVDIWARRAESGVMSALQSTRSHADVRLTRRECQVLAQIAAGASNREIAGNLGIAKQVAANYRCRIMKKFGTKSAADLVRMALADAADASSKMVLYPLRKRPDLTSPFKHPFDWVGSARPLRLHARCKHADDSIRAGKALSCVRARLLMVGGR
jgi:DNA-binding CsgD family transcriptional regulator